MRGDERERTLEIDPTEHLVPLRTSHSIGRRRGARGHSPRRELPEYAPRGAARGQIPLDSCRGCDHACRLQQQRAYDSLYQGIQYEFDLRETSITTYDNDGSEDQEYKRTMRSKQLVSLNYQPGIVFKERWGIAANIGGMIQRYRYDQQTRTWDDSNWDVSWFEDQNGEFELAPNLGVEFACALDNIVSFQAGGRFTPGFENHFSGGSSSRQDFTIGWKSLRFQVGITFRDGPPKTSLALGEDEGKDEATH